MRDSRPGQLKTGLVLPLFLAGAAVLVGRLYDIQIKNHEYLVEQARRQSQTSVELAANRGTIFDCNGSPLALSLKTPAVFADPGIAAVPARARRWLPQVLGLSDSTFGRFLAARPRLLRAVDDPTRRRMLAVTRSLSEFLNVPEEPLVARLEAAMNARLSRAARGASPILGMPEAKLRRLLGQERRFVWLKRKVNEASARRIRGLRIRGICVRGEDRRASTVAGGLNIGQWLGFVGTEGRGLCGLELAYESQLRGTPGLARLDRDGRGRRIADSADPTVRPRHGCNLYLTVDRRIQAIVDEELARLYAEFSPSSASVIVMNPSTGRILAMGSVPGLDISARHGMSAGELARRSRNHPVQSVYEYGSTFKPFIVAAVLELGLVTPDFMIHCENGLWNLRGRSGRVIRRLRDHRPYGPLSVTDVLVYSSNIGAAKLGRILGADRLRRYLSYYHFGRRWGIELPAEEPGIVTSARRWTEFTTTSVPMGQEIAGTPLQLITAFCALINGGRLMRPYIVERVENPNTGEVTRRRPRVMRRVVSRGTSATMRRIMAQVVQRGTGRRLRNSRYPIGGKTGTAQKSAPGGYSHEEYVASFVGFAPVDRPRICVLVLVDEPSGGRYYGGQVAAPTAGRIIDRALATLELAPQRSADDGAIALSQADG